MEERKTVGQQLLDVVGILLRGFWLVLGWVAKEVEVTLNLFRRVPSMFIELVLAIVFTLVYLFPSGETMGFIARIGTELAIPFLLGVIYATINMIWVAIYRERGVGWGWCYLLVKGTLFPTILDYLIFANRPFQRFIGWGDPASTLRFCVFLVWGVVLANVLVVQLEARAPQHVVKVPFKE